MTDAEIEAVRCMGIRPWLCGRIDLEDLCDEAIRRGQAVAALREREEYAIRRSAGRALRLLFNLDCRNQDCVRHNIETARAQLSMLVTTASHLDVDDAIYTELTTAECWAWEAHERYLVRPAVDAINAAAARPVSTGLPGLGERRR